MINNKPITKNLQQSNSKKLPQLQLLNLEQLDILSGGRTAGRWGDYYQMTVDPVD